MCFTGTDYPSRAPELIPNFEWSPCCSFVLVFCIVLCILFGLSSFCVMCPTLSVFLNCQLLIAHSDFFNVYLRMTLNFALTNIGRSGFITFTVHGLDIVNIYLNHANKDFISIKTKVSSTNIHLVIVNIGC